MAFTTFPSVGPYAPETLTADLNTNFGKTIEAALATVADGEFLVYDGSSSVWINRTAAEAGIPSSVADLGDVTIATVADGEFMIYDGSSASWINATAAEAGIPDNLEDLTNVSVATPADGDVLTYDGSSGTWINGTGAAGDLAGLTDTSIATPADGEVLTYDGSSGAWINATGGAGSSTLSGLTDTTITSPADGEFLIYDNATSKWVNSTGTTAYVERTYQEVVAAGGASAATFNIPADCIKLTAQAGLTLGGTIVNPTLRLRRQSDGVADAFSTDFEQGSTSTISSGGAPYICILASASTNRTSFFSEVLNPRSTTIKTTARSVIRQDSAERLRDFIAVQSTAADLDEFEFTAGGSSTITGDIFVTYTVLELASAIGSNPTTVASLPTGVAGQLGFVTDATATTFASIVAGGGSNGVPVYNDGTNWRVG